MELFLSQYPNDLANMALFQPIQVGDMRLSHRAVMSPVTLFACNSRREHYELGAKYYGQRASTKGTMIITEGTYIAERAVGWYNVPGIWTVGQIAGWKMVRYRLCHFKSRFLIFAIG
jgi:NADPH2 dehydrogenase